MIYYINILIIKMGNKQFVPCDNWSYENNCESINSTSFSVKSGIKITAPKAIYSHISASSSNRLMPNFLCKDCYLKVNNKKNYKQHEKGFYIGYSGDLLTIFYY